MSKNICILLALVTGSACGPTGDFSPTAVFQAFSSSPLPATADAGSLDDGSVVDSVPDASAGTDETDSGVPATTASITCTARRRRIVDVGVCTQDIIAETDAHQFLPSGPSAEGTSA